MLVYAARHVSGIGMKAVSKRQTNRAFVACSVGALMLCTVMRTFSTVYFFVDNLKRE